MINYKVWKGLAGQGRTFDMTLDNLLKIVFYGITPSQSKESLPAEEKN